MSELPQPAATQGSVILNCSAVGPAARSSWIVAPSGPFGQASRSGSRAPRTRWGRPCSAGPGAVPRSRRRPGPLLRGCQPESSRRPGERSAEVAPRDGRPRADAAHARGRDQRVLRGRPRGRAKGGRQRGKKALCGVAIEVRDEGSGRLRLAVLPDASEPALLAFTQATTAPGAIVHTDGLQSYRVLAKHGYIHRRRPQDSALPGEQLLPRANRAVSNFKAWMDGTHRGVSDQHLPVQGRSAEQLSARVTLAQAAPRVLPGPLRLHRPGRCERHDDVARSRKLAGAIARRRPRDVEVRGTAAGAGARRAMARVAVVADELDRRH
jgi:transposase-like protein